jgi:hypothetical protein
MEIEASFVCSYCLQFNTVTVTLHILVSPELDTADINAVAA